MFRSHISLNPLLVRTKCLQVPEDSRRPSVLRGGRVRKSKSEKKSRGRGSKLITHISLVYSTPARSVAKSTPTHRSSVSIKWLLGPQSRYTGSTRYPHFSRSLDKTQSQPSQRIPTCTVHHFIKMYAYIYGYFLYYDSQMVRSVRKKCKLNSMRKQYLKIELQPGQKGSEIPTGVRLVHHQT